MTTLAEVESETADIDRRASGCSAGSCRCSLSAPLLPSADSGEGDLDCESRAGAVFRLDVERPLDRCDSFAHSHKPESAPRYLRAGEAAS